MLRALSTFAVIVTLSADAWGNDKAQAEQHYQAGVDYLKQKKVPLAVDSLKKAIALNPKHAPSRRALGLSYLLLNQDAKAIEQFELFVSLAPRDLNTARMRDYIAGYYKRAGLTPPCQPSSAFDASPGREALKKGYVAGERAMALGDPLSAICILERVKKEDSDYGAASLLLRTAREQASTVARAWLTEIDLQISAEQYSDARARCRFLKEQFPLDRDLEVEVDKRLKQIDAAILDARDLLYDVAAQAHDMLLASDLKGALQLLCSSRPVVWRVDDQAALAWERSISSIAFRMGGEYPRRVDIASVCEQTREPPKPEAAVAAVEPDKPTPAEGVKVDGSSDEPTTKKIVSPPVQKTPEQRRAANLFAQAEEHRGRKDYFRAIRSYRAVLDVDAKNTAAARALEKMEDQRKTLMKEYQAKANDYLLSQDLAAAVPYYERLLVLDPGNPAAKDGMKMFENLEKLRRGK